MLQGGATSWSSNSKNVGREETTFVRALSLTRQKAAGHTSTRMILGVDEVHPAPRVVTLGSASILGAVSDVFCGCCYGGVQA